LYLCAGAEQQQLGWRYKGDMAKAGSTDLRDQDYDLVWVDNVQY